MKIRAGFRLLIVSLGSLLLLGCVMSEKYEQEKARGLNFQRLLAQEEKRTAELDAELKKVRRQLTEMEAQNRELSSELQTVREEYSQSQEKSMALKETATLGEMAEKEFGNADTTFGTEEDPLSNFGFDDPSPASSAPTGSGTAIRHEVMPGETLFRLSRTYGVKVDQIKEWNGLRDNIIVVGQQLIVGYE